jgi:AcrR family transcriptional regulator
LTTADRLIQAAIAEIAEVGVDRLVTAQLAKRAGVARSSIYNHFEDQDDLFAEIWLRYGRDWLNRLASAENFGANLVEDEVNLDLALLELFAVAHRFAELGGLVSDTTRVWWRQVSVSETVQLQTLWRAGIRIGIELSRPITPGITAAASTNRFIAAIGAATEQNAFDAGNTNQLNLVADPFVVFETEEERILLAAIKVIADHGVARASIARIARRAGVTKGSLYSRFENAQSIISSGFALSLIRVVDANVGQLIAAGISPTTLTEVALNALQREREVWRNFRTELHVAARQSAKLSAEMAGAFETTRLSLAAVAANYTPDPLDIYALTQAMQATSVGWPILFANGAAIENVNYIRLFSALAAGVFELSQIRGN